jgi:hypothetical protein
MVSSQPALSLSGRQVVVRGAGLTGRQVKPRAAAWRPLSDNPSGRVGLHAILRHRSVMYRHTFPLSSLSCAQTDPGAGREETMERL